MTPNDNLNTAEPSGADTSVKICVIGGDLRQRYIAELLKDVGFCVSVYAVPTLSDEYTSEGCDGIRICDRLYDALSGSYAVILPFPLSPDGLTLNCAVAERPKLSEIFMRIAESGAEMCFAGMVKERSAKIAESVGIKLTDYGESAEITAKNAIPTAEGAVGIAMRETDHTVHASEFAVVGYGKCGSAIARLLKAMGGNVRGFARSAHDRAKMYNDGVSAYPLSELEAELGGVSVIFNTVPAEIFDCHMLSHMKKNVLIIDVASAPGGVDPVCAQAYGIRAVHAASLPGKYAPATAAKIICDHIIPLIDSSLADRSLRFR